MTSSSAGRSSGKTRIRRVTNQKLVIAICNRSIDTILTPSSKCMMKQQIAVKDNAVCCGSCWNSASKPKPCSRLEQLLFLLFHYRYHEAPDCL